MREILFRGKRKSNGGWVVGNLFVPDKRDTPTQICVGTNVVMNKLGEFIGAKVEKEGEDTE